MHTIVIAGNQQTADSICKYFMCAEAERKDTCWQNDAGTTFTPEFRSRYEAVPCFAAYKSLIGARPDRIVVGCDYLRWRHFLEPGRLTNLWRMIETARLRGTKVVFK